MLADVPMGESPIGGVCSVATVVISDRGKGDRPVGKLGGKSLRWLGKTPVRSARETRNSTGRSESEQVKRRNTGKLVVATTPEEEAELPVLAERGRVNGVAGLRTIGQAEIRAREPNIVGHAAIEVPSTELFLAKNL